MYYFTQASVWLLMKEYTSKLKEIIRKSAHKNICGKHWTHSKTGEI